MSEERTSRCGGGFAAEFHQLQAVVCPVPDSRYTPAVCEPSGGGRGPATPNLDGEACDDGDACTSADHCQRGACSGTAVTRGGAKDTCHEVEVCERA